MKRSFAILLGCLTPLPSFAAAVHLTDYDWACTGFLHCGTYDIIVYLLNNLISGVLLFIGALATVAFFYGALRMILSRGEEGKEVGKKALIYGALGLVAAIISGAIVEFVCAYLYIIGGAAGPSTCPSIVWPI